jgi:hypothetical protein
LIPCTQASSRGAFLSNLRQTTFPCGLTFELSGPHRQGAWAARRMMNHNASRPKCLAGVGPLERRVRPHADRYNRVLACGTSVACDQTACQP